MNQNTLSQTEGAFSGSTSVPENTHQAGFSVDSQPPKGSHTPTVNIETEKRTARERIIKASIVIPQPIEQVWQVITDYERLADFIPSLTSSKLVNNTEGRIRLEQIGAQCFLKIKFCARVVLDMTENFPNKVSFCMKEGDFKQFEGAWYLEATTDSTSTLLSYNLRVKPPLAMPSALIERHLCHNLTQNLVAVHQRTLALSTQ